MGEYEEHLGFKEGRKMIACTVSYGWDVDWFFWLLVGIARGAGELVGISISVTPKRLGIVNFMVQKVHCKRNLLAYKASKLVS